MPLARWGETHDIGLAAVYLSSAAGGYVNAETLVVDGGHWLARLGARLLAGA